MATSNARIIEELAVLFLKLGSTAFGGPAVHIALMEEEVVRKRKWMSHKEFLDLVSITNFIPGPNSTELAIHIGYLRAGWLGLLVAGISFIAPSALIVTACASFYVQYGHVPQVASIFYGIKPVMVAVVGQALWTLGKSICRTQIDYLVVALSVLLTFVGMHELAVLFVSGFLVASFKGFQRSTKNEGISGLVGGLSVGATTTAAIATVSNKAIFVTFIKIGSMLFGSGYVLIAFLRTEFVEKLQWLSESQLLDAVSIGQITPGPVFTTATFVGYLLNGTQGAFFATSGIFLPAFFFVAISGLIVPSIRKSKPAGYFLDGLNLASLALMIAISFQLGKAALVDYLTVFISIISLCLMVKYKVKSATLFAAGAFFGFLKNFL